VLVFNLIGFGLKDRNSIWCNHEIFDAVRGATKYIVLIDTDGRKLMSRLRLFIKHLIVMDLVYQAGATAVSMY
jgi:hypothetical protein